jgi:hypothetical protein
MHKNKMSMELIGSMDVIWYDFAQRFGISWLLIFVTPADHSSDPADSHGPDDHPKTID